MTFAVSLEGDLRAHADIKFDQAIDQLFRKLSLIKTTISFFHRPMDTTMSYVSRSPPGHLFSSNVVVQLTANGEQHRRLRRLLAHAFSDRALRLQEACLQGYVNLFISQLRKQAATDTGVVNMVHWFNFTTFDIIGDLAFGDSFSLLKNGKWSRYLSSIFGLLEYNAFHRLAISLIPLPGKRYIAEQISPKSNREDFYYQDQMSREKLSRRVTLESERQDFGIYPSRTMRDLGLMRTCSILHAQRI